MAFRGLGRRVVVDDRKIVERAVAAENESAHDCSEFLH
jgi:hypothetical protein